MSKTLATACAAILLTFSVAAPASAQAVNARQANQQQRIREGVHSGDLTVREASKINQQRRVTRAQERRMRARNGGRLTRADRDHLNARLDRQSRQLHRLRHNGVSRYDRRVCTYRHGHRVCRYR